MPSYEKESAYSKQSMHNYKCPPSYRNIGPGYNQPNNFFFAHEGKNNAYVLEKMAIEQGGDI